MGTRKKNNKKAQARKKAKRRANREFDRRLVEFNQISIKDKEIKQKIRKLKAGIKIQL